MTSERQRVVVTAAASRALLLAARPGADTTAETETETEVTVLGELTTVGAPARSWQDAETLTDLFHLLTDDGGS
ncbi:hypothetical protein CP980_22695 [Streptomyces vinaceus]|uniref:Uncharacterized protein n=1 Tax=Streptomyces vinaceus TaxID=1960 RepID=A0A5J6J9C6_STRVI|nr:hypothetical protein [Streptomyces vinaceus]QEV47509.1 hypothetical protein CP980_22695 [Streptomyces vinaceus]GHE54164.1 hypothetical protein GCM10017778_43110 [Streptomyces vinaceus]